MGQSGASSRADESRGQSRKLGSSILRNPLQTLAQPSSHFLSPRVPTGHMSDTRRLVVATSLSGSAVNFSLTETRVRPEPWGQRGWKQPGSREAAERCLWGAPWHGTGADLYLEGWVRRRDLSKIFNNCKVKCGLCLGWSSRKGSIT